MFAAFRGSIAALLVAGSVLGAGPARAADRIIVFAADYSRTDAEAIGAALATVFAKLTAGDRLTGIAAGQTVFEVSVPDEKIFAEHVVHRNKLLAPAWARVVDTLRKAIAAREAGGGSSQVDLPGAIVALRYAAARHPEVLVVGNPLYQDRRMPTFSFATGYPSDGNFSVSPGQSPFGTRGIEKSLSGIPNVHFCLTSGVEWKNTAHLESVHRFYSLYSEALGTHLSTFSADIMACARRFSEKDNSGARKFQRDSNDSRIAMVEVSEPFALSAALQAEIGSGVTRMVELDLYDTDAEDGDVVDIVGAGFTKRVALAKLPQRVVVPVTRGALGVLGIHDGTGGITVGIRTPSGRVIVSRNIRVGESIQIPLGGL